MMIVMLLLLLKILKNKYFYSYLLIFVKKCCEDLSISSMSTVFNFLNLFTRVSINFVESSGSTCEPVSKAITSDKSEPCLKSLKSVS